MNGQVALVTGGGRGLGRAFAQALAAVGAAVSVTAKSRNQVEETVKSIEDQGGRGRAISVVGNISNPDDVERIVSFTEEQLGPVDLLVNKAGVGGEVKPDWDTDPQDWWRTME